MRGNAQVTIGGMSWLLLHRTFALANFLSDGSSPIGIGFTFIAFGFRDVAAWYGFAFRITAFRQHRVSFRYVFGFVLERLVALGV